MENNVHDLRKDQFMLTGGFARDGYDWWWHSFTAENDATGEEKSFFVEFFLCNPALGGSKPIYGQLVQNKIKGLKPSYLMVKAGCWGKDARQLNRFFGWDEVDLGLGVPFYVAADDCLACETDLIGHVKVTEEEAKRPELMSDAGEMYFDLHLKKNVAFNVGYGTSKPMRDLQAFDMYWHAEGIKTFVEGKVILDGQSYTVKPGTSYGYADKNWGRDFTSPWLWLASSNLRSNITGKHLYNSAFDIGGGRPKFMCFPMERKLLSMVFYEGHEFEFNFSKFWTKCTTDFAFKEFDDEVEWVVSQSTRWARIDVDVKCKKEDMLFVNYEAPDGTKRHNRLWNGGTGTGRILLFERSGRSLKLVDDIEALNVGCEYGEYTN